MKRYFFRVSLSALISLFFIAHVSTFYRVPLFETLDAFIYDVRLRLLMPNTLDDRVVILDIDERSLEKEGQWPWSRNKLAAMANALFDHYQIKVLGFDVVFAEYDNSSGLSSLEKMGKDTFQNQASFQAELPRLRKTLNYDALFAQSLENRPVVLGYYFSQDGHRKGGALPAPALEGWMVEEGSLPAISLPGYGANIRLLQEKARSGGHFLPDIDFDGIARRVPMLIEHEGNFYEALSLAMVRTALGNPALLPESVDGFLEALSFTHEGKKTSIPVDERLSTLIAYRGRPYSFPYVSLVDVIAKKIDKKVLEGKFVLLGTSTPGLMDLRATPVSNVYPGVEIHANLIASILDGNMPHKPAYVTGAYLLEVILFSLLLVFLLPILSPLKASFLMLLLTGLSIGINLYAWSLGLLMPLSTLLLALFTLYLFHMCWGYFVESKTRRQFATLFGQYVPPELVQEMAKDPSRYSMEGQNRTLSILFSDVRDFTSISEGLPPKELTQLMNLYLGEMTTVIQAERGTLDKYIGDAIMAFWGAPIEDNHHAHHAVSAALKMQKALLTLNTQFENRGWAPIAIGVGINTGNVTVGDMGSIVRKAYTVMGDAVNLASRLEGLSKVYGAGILIGEETYQNLTGIFCREIDLVQVKGKEKPVRIFEPLCLEKDASNEHIETRSLWNSGLAAYRAQHFDEALAILKTLLETSPTSKLYALYVARIASYRLTPPEENWTGVTRFVTK